MTKVTLHRIKRKAGAVWLLRWYGESGRRFGEVIGECKKLAKKDAEAARREKQGKLDNRIEEPDRPRRMTLEAFASLYMKRRERGDVAPSRPWHKRYAKLAPTTLREHDMGLRYLVQHFGPGKPIDSIRQGDADAFLDALSAGKLADARRPTRRRFRLGEQRVRGLIRVCKAIFGWARTFRYVTSNPFAGFDGASTATAATDRNYVTTDDLETILAVCEPGSGWRELFALCRLAGLRRGEALDLPWSGRAFDRTATERRTGIDWERRRICLVAPKTGAYREVPLCARLHDVLLEAFSRAPEGRVAAVDLSSNNLNRDAEKIIRRGGLRPWPRVFQSMRSSCENDWKLAGVNEPTYCCWLGHSPTVSRRHYVSPTEAEFAAVSGHAQDTFTGKVRD